MSTIRQQIQMEFAHFKQHSMQQLDEIYDQRISTLQQQRQGMKLALEQVIDYQLHVTLETLGNAQCSLKQEVDSLKVHFTRITDSLL